MQLEVRVLMLHGLLHLAGFDHERDCGEMAGRSGSPCRMASSSAEIPEPRRHPSAYAVRPACSRQAHRDKQPRERAPWIRAFCINDGIKGEVEPETKARIEPWIESCNDTSIETCSETCNETWVESCNNS